jgi:hypothetical protein
MVSIERLLEVADVRAERLPLDGESYYELTIPFTDEDTRWLRRMGQERIIRWLHSHIALSRAAELAIQSLPGDIGVGCRVNAEDLARLGTNELRVAAVMADGEWHRMIDLRVPGIGGSAADSRIRDLRRKHDAEFDVRNANQMREAGHRIPEGQRGGTTYYRCVTPDILIALIAGHIRS